MLEYQLIDKIVIKIYWIYACNNKVFGVVVVACLVFVLTTPCNLHNSSFSSFKCKFSYDIEMNSFYYNNNNKSVC